tara:strand:- start:10442 stop:10696 length:255 start_codon:yes stop_codon:yes gene_type:complete
MSDESASDGAYRRPEKAVASLQSSESGEFFVSEREEAFSGSVAEVTQFVERKIIYSFHVHPVLKKTYFEQFEQEIRSLLQKYEG